MKKIILFILFLAVLGLVWYGLTHRPPTTSMPAVPSQQPPATTVSYACDAGKSITAVFTDGQPTPVTATDLPPTPGGSVALSLSDGRAMTLAQTISADGVRYANQDESFVFWSKGNGALVLEHNVEKSYTGCIQVAPASATLPRVYSTGAGAFSIRLPQDYQSNELYTYTVTPTKTIHGVKFTIPPALAKGTNLGSDTYISVEQIPQTQVCSAALFLDGGNPVSEQTDGDTTYSVSSSNGAGAGNRYEETVYAIPGTNPCIAVRYFIHYSVFENYPAGSIKAFDKAALISTFDDIRRTLIINQ